jgi:hypothetical protein
MVLIIFSLISFLREESRLIESCCACVSQFQLLNQLTSFHETWHVCFIIIAFLGYQERLFFLTS